MPHLSPKPRCTILGALAAALLAIPAGAETMPQEPPPQETQLSLALLFDESANGATVEAVAWRPQRPLPAGPRSAAGELLGVWDDESGKAWWVFRTDGSKSLLVRPDDLGLARVGEARSVAWGGDGAGLLFALPDGAVLFDVATRSVRRLVEGEADDPRLSPDGRRLAFARHGDLYVRELESGETRRLTEDGEPGVVLNGTTDWVYWEEIWDRKSQGTWWSGDSRRLAYYHFDDARVPVYPLVDTRPVHPALELQRYPKAGDPLPLVELRIFDLESGRTVRLQTGDDPEAYLARVHWRADGAQVAVERLNRGQDQLDLLLCSAQDGSCRTLATQREKTWVNVANAFTFLSDGRFLWSSEESGWCQLYLHQADGGGRRQLTPDGWTLASLDAVDEPAGTFVYTAYSTGTLGAAERHLFRGRLDGGEPERLTEEKGWHQALVSPSSPHWLHTWSSSHEEQRQVLGHLDRPGFGRPLPSRPPSYDLAKLPQWEFLTIPGPGGVELPAQLMKPLGFDPERRYPVLMYHYGGPASQVVDDFWHAERRRYLWQRFMAERGYVVFSVDNEASRFFGKRGAEKLYRRFGEVEMRAQLAGVEYLKAQPWVDAGRIGLWGWSGGGTHTLYCLFKNPGVWKAGVSGAPVTDWHTYDAVWTERYFDLPSDNEEGYEASSPLTYAEGLADALLLIHGTGDNNVHLQNTLNLADALVKAGKRFEMALYPNARHSLETFEGYGQRHLFERITEFFDRHLREE